MQNNIHKVMENSHLFEGLRPDLIDEIASSATCRTVAAGEILFQKGDPADALWGVLSGRIVIEVSTDDGKEMVLSAFGKGEVFGEVGVIDFGPRRVEARATQESELFRLERKHFLKHLQSSPELCFRVFSLLCSHLRETTENLEDTALHKLPSRLAKRLIMLAADSKENGATILHIGQSDLASILGVNREAVNRHLRVFEKDGLIALRRQKIEIVDQQALADLASPGQNGDYSGWEIRHLASLKSRSFTFNLEHENTPTPPERHLAGLIAIDAAEYSRHLMTDAAGTLKRIEAGLNAIDQAIEKYRGHTVWHTGDRVLAEFPDAQLAAKAALTIQEKVNPVKMTGKDKQDLLFRIGVHYGEVSADDHSFVGEAVNTVIRLTELVGAGGIMISGAVRDALKGRQQLDLQFLGDHELKNIPATVPVYSARKIPMLKMLALRAETRVPRRFHMATVTAALVVLLAGFWFTGDRMGRKSAPLTVSQLSIAVLPFTTSGDMDPDHFVDAIPEQIRTMLSTIPGMRVIGRESSDYFKDHSVSTAEIAQTLKVAWLLRGSLKTVENGIQMTAQLLNAVTDEVVWEDQFQALQQNPATLGPDIGRRIAVSLGVIDSDGVGLPQLLPVTNNAEAHAIYFEALSHIWRGRQRNAIKAVPLLQSAVELDPSFAEAHATLASVYLQTSLLDRQDAYNPELRQELAMQSLQKALSLKPNSPLVLAKAALARLFGDDYTGALALADRALRIDPNNSEALRVRYFVQSEQRNWVGALQTSEQILRLEPLSVNAMSYHVDELQNADRHQEALSIAKMALALYPESEVPQAHAWAAESKLILGDRVGAIESSRKGMPYGSPIDLWTGLEYDWGFFDDIDPVRSAVGLVYVEEYDQVRQLLMDKWGVSDPGSTEVNSLDYLVNRGELEALVGDLNTSVEFFEKARLLAPDEEGGLIKAGVWFRVLDWSRQSHFSLALLFAYRKSGQHEKAQIIAGQFESMVAKSIENLSNVSHLVDYSFLYEEAQYYAIEGRRAEALGKLRTWVDYGKNIFTYIKWDPFLESLHGDPEFEAIVAEVEAELAEVRVLYHARQGELAETGSG